MVSTVKHKRSAVAGKIPSTTDLDLGQLAINTTDGKLFLKKSDGGTESIIDVGKDSETAVKLKTPRNIGGVSFDGTADINLPGVNAPGNQSTSGNAATATKLATARTINGVSFDGSANITVADSTKLPLAGGTLSGDLTVTGSLTLDGRNVDGALDERALLTDPRFTDAREWTAATVDQAEAEAGTATTRRAWTAQRVAQAARGVLLTGYALGSNAAVAATDTVMGAIGKLQAQVNSKLNANANAVSASKLANARNVQLSGDVSGEAWFDGSGDINIPLVFNNSGVTAGTYAKVTVNTKGLVTAGSVLAASDIPALPMSTVSGLNTALAGKVDNTDSRLSDEREWSASVVTQAEAEAGTSTTFRKWTAQRVRQAIVAGIAPLVSTAKVLVGTADDGTNALQVGGDASLRGNTGFGNDNPTHRVDVTGDVRVRDSGALKMGGTGLNDVKASIQYNATTKSIDFVFSE